MKIAILTRELLSNTNITTTSIPNTYLNIIKERAYPIIIDNTLNLKKYKDNLIKQINDIDGVVIPGGDKISEVDLFIIDYCYKNGIYDFFTNVYLDKFDDEFKSKGFIEYRNIKEDILNVLDSSHEVKTEEIKNDFTKRLISSLVRIFAPLL